jgi:IS605 OrfB family transposase
MAATKTIIKQLESKKVEAVAETKKLYNEAIKFYFELLQDHQGLLDLATKPLLTELEKLTVETLSNPAPAFPLPWNLPAMFRRSAINTAIGQARSFHSNLIRWHKKKEKAVAKGKKFNERPPQPPKEFNQHPVYYLGMYQIVNQEVVILKLFTGQSWIWVKYQMKGREFPEGFKQASPKLVLKRKKILLHISFEKKIEVQTIKQQLTKDSQNELVICSVDLNINNNLAVCRIIKADGTLLASRFIAGGKASSGRRKRALGRVAKKRRKTGNLRKGEQDNKRLWKYINNLDNYEAHRVSRRIVEFAFEYGARVIVFEHLGNFRPQKGKYSRRGNEKRTFWLRGKIYHFTHYKAYELGILTSRVNPRNTSRHCAYCGKEVARHNYNEEPKEYKAGAPLFTCPSGHRGNADLNASNNIGLRLFARFNKTISLKKPALKKVGVSALYTGSGQDSRDGQAAPPELAVVHYDSNSVALTGQGLLLSSTPARSKILSNHT